MSRKKDKHTRAKTAVTGNEMKKAEVLGRTDEKKAGTTLLLAGFLVVLLVAAAVVVLLWPGTPQSDAGTAPVSVPVEGVVTHPVDDFNDGKAHFFTYDAKDGATVKYFVLKSSDGVIRAAFDACDVCWPAGLGYEQAGDYMVCRNCGRQFISTRINEEQGGCNPAPLERKIDGNQVIIQASDIVKGKAYFDLPSKS